MTANKPILVLGRSGQVGREIEQLSAASPGDWVFWGRSELDLTQPEAIEKAIAGCRPGVVINCAAYTAVDQAERETQLAEQINHEAVASIAQACKRIDARLIHLSTDYVFAGDQCTPYRPDDATAPSGHYGRSKLRGEQAIRQAGTAGIIIRTSWVYSRHGHNFVKTMLRLGAEKSALRVVADQIGSPTWARDLARALIHIARHPALATKSGDIYHYSNSGVCSWFDFAAHIFQARNLPCELAPIRTEEYPTPAARPHYSVLDCQKIRADFGVTTPYWYDSLRRALAEF